MYADVDIIDGAGKGLYSNHNWRGGKWGLTETIKASDTKLPNDILVYYHNGDTHSNTKRDVGIVGPPPKVPTSVWQKWIVEFTAGGANWWSDQNDESQLPYCKVGGWEDGDELFGTSLPSRQMDCYWSCW